MKTALLAFAVAALCLTVGQAADKPEKSKTWQFDNLQKIGGHAVTVLGKPRLIDTPSGKAITFDGVDDGLFFDVHPLAGLSKFTVEVIFRPDADGPKEQRFFHMQEAKTENRVMFETRVTDDGRWYLDTFIKSGEGNYTQLAEKHKHPCDRWYHAALVVDGREMRHYVNGKLELTTKIDYTPQQPGRTSLGVRQNKVFWFKGGIRTARFTPRALSPKQFLKAK
jgi:hypothetical protein